MDCIGCKSLPNLDVPLLTCGCYYCCACYTKLRSNGIHLCVKHEKPLRRGRKKNT